MPVDRGELRYPITVEDNFSENLKKFQDGLAASQKAWESLRASGAQGASFGASLGTELRQADEGLRNFTSNVQNNVLAMQHNNSQHSTLIQNIRNYSSAQRTSTNNTNQATTQLLQFSRAIGISSTQINALGGLLGPVGVAIGVVSAAIAGAALVIKTMASDAINLNSAMETAGRGIAAVALATGQVADQTGRAVTGTRAVNLAFTEGTRQAGLLRKEMVDTSATFEDLEKVFKSSLGPGLSAGLNIDQIRKFSEALTQAGISSAQQGSTVAREAAHIFEGTTKGNTLTAMLGISAQDLESARQAGTLVDLLTSKLKAFQEVGARSGETYEGSLTRIQNLIERILTTGGKDFFESIKSLLQDTLKVLKDNEPQILSFFTRVFALMSAGVDFFHAWAAGVLQLGGAVRDVLQGDFASAADKLKAFGFGEAANGTKNQLNEIGESFFKNLDTAWNGPVAKAKTFSSILDTMPASITASSVAFEKEGAVIEKLESDLRKAQQGLPLASAGSGGRGGSNNAADVRADRAERKLQLEAEFKASEDIREITSRQKTAETDLNTALAEQAALKQRILGLSGYEQAAIMRAVKLTNDLSELQAKGASADEIKAKQDDLNRTGGHLLPEAQERIKTAYEQTIALQGRVAADERTINGSKETQLKVQNLINQALALRVTALADKETHALEQQIPLLEAQARAQQRVASAKARQLAGTGSASDVRIAEAQGSLEEAQARALTNAQKFDAEQKETQAAIADAKQRANGESAESVALERQLADEIKKNSALRDQDTAKIQLANAELQHAKAVENAPGSTAFTDYLTKFQGNLPVYEATLHTMQSGVADFASFASNAIADAFNPNKKKGDLLAAFGGFLNQLGHMILNQIIQIAVAKSLLGVFGGVAPAAAGAATSAAAAGAGAGAFGWIGGAFSNAIAAFATGGQVASPAHYGHGARGFAFGGGPPPGIPASDTVPAWLTPGEWVMRLAAVQRYGADVMNKINDGLVDPSSLRAVVGPDSRAIRAPRGGSFATGGMISEALAAHGTVMSSAASKLQTPQRAVVVPDEQSFSRMVAGGHTTLMRWHKDNAAELSGIYQKARGVN